jgi:hypothetical protein
MSVGKRIVKACFNAWLRRQGLQTVDYFGDLDSLEPAQPPCSDGIGYEIMVHPDLDANGKLIDRMDGRDLLASLMAVESRWHRSSFRLALDDGACSLVGNWPL